VGLNIKYWVDQSLSLLRANKQWEREQNSLRLQQKTESSIDTELEAKIKQYCTSTPNSYTHVLWAVKILRFYRTKQETIKIIDMCLRNPSIDIYTVAMSQVFN
jgi:hypothetical protein